MFLEPNENYIKRCGEIFLTTIGNIIFHCTLCDMKYRGFEKYADHLRNEHLFSVLASGCCETDSQHSQTNKSKDNASVMLNTEEHTVLLISDSECFEDDFDSTKSNVNEDDIDIKLKIVHQQILPNKTIKDEIVKLEEEQREQCSPTQILIEKDLKYKETDSEIQDCNKVSTNSNKTYDQKPTHSRNLKELKIPGEIREMRRACLSEKRKTPDELRKHKCPICGTAFKERHNLIHHFRRHSNSRNHSCSECGKKFYTKSEVKVHMRVHTGLRPFLCVQCGLTFLQNSHLVNHMKRHNNQRDYKCSECGKKFFNKSCLKVHLTTHSTERQFSCNFCDAKFARRQGLSQHLKRHEIKKEYKCEVCNASFNQFPGLQNHRKLNHKK